jgi:hypothetical protein
MPTLDENLDRLDARGHGPDAVIRVRVVNVNIPFFQMVWLLLKLAIAAIPAALIFFLLAGLVGAAVATLMGGAFSGMFNGFHWI